PRLYQALSTRRLLRPEEAAGCDEHCAWVEAPAPGQHAVLAVHVGEEVLLALGGRHEAADLLPPEAMPPALAAALPAATLAVARLLNEGFGAAHWGVDLRRGRIEFRDYPPNPDGRTLAGLGPRLFPMIWRFLTAERR